MNNNTYEFIEDIPQNAVNGQPHDQHLYRINEDYYVVSRVTAMDHKRWETMIFPSDNKGEIQSYQDVYVYIGWEEIEQSVKSYVRKLEENKKHQMVNDYDWGDDHLDYEG